MWKLWKSASNPCAASKTGLENLWINGTFSTGLFTLTGFGKAQQIQIRFAAVHFLPD